MNQFPMGEVSFDTCTFPSPQLSKNTLSSKNLSSRSKKSIFSCQKLIPILILAASFFSIPNSYAQPDNIGTEFWLMFNQNHNGGGTQTLFISGQTATNGVVDIPGIGFNQAFTITPGTVTSIPLPNDVDVITSDIVESKGIHITADDDIAVYGLNQQSATTDAFLGMPADVLGLEYIVLAYNALNSSLGAQFGIVATANSTTVTITPSVTVGIRTAGVPYNIIMNQGEVYQLESDTANEDLTGTIITSSAPIGVFGGAECVNVPFSALYCDHLVEQLPSTDTWGTQFLTSPLATRTGGDIFRILSSVDATDITLNGTVVATLNRGEFHEMDLSSVSYNEISATNPVLLAQYSKGTTADNVTSDPFMMLIPPFEQYSGAATFSTPASGFSVHYVNLVIQDPGVGSVMLDGVVIPAGDFTSIGSSGFSGAQISVTAGVHSIFDPNNFLFGGLIYGFGSADSYGYPSGSLYSPAALVTSMTLSPTSGGSSNTGMQHCVTTTVLDQNDMPLENIRVDFNVTGVNPNTNFVFTDANGEAEYCYTGVNGGDDLITASIGSLSASGTKTWVTTCGLVVDCSAIVDMTVSCRQDLPPVDFTLPMVIDSCGDIILSALTIISGNSGCPNDTLFIDRTYFIQDGVSPVEECMQTFTIISAMDPMFTSFPSDTIVLCGADTAPTSTGMAEGSQECDFSAGDAVVTFADLIVPGACPAESTITRTWTVTDACGRTTMMDQTIMVRDTVAPAMLCQVATIELDALGMATLTTADLDAGSTDACGGPITLSLSMENFTCADVGENDVWLIGEDECGNQDSCMAVVTVEDNIDPVIVCPSDVTLDCAQEYNFSITATDNCNTFPVNEADFTLIGILNGTSYYRSNASFTWAQANADAQANGGNLVSITSMEENDFVAGSFVHIGANDLVLEGTFAWTDGELFGYSNWEAGEPNNLGNEDGVIMLPNGKWNDIPANLNVLPYIFEAPDGPRVLQTMGEESGEFLDLGTHDYTFVATDGSGNTSECSFTVTVQDVDPPVIMCNDDVTVNSDMNLCVAEVEYTMPLVMDNCTIDAEASQAVNEMLVSTSADCIGLAANHHRYFENTLNAEIAISEVNFGIATAGVGQSVTIKIYSIDPADDFIYANLTELASSVVTVPNNINNVIMTEMIAATIPANKNYVLTIETPSTQDFIMGYNTSGETAPTFVGGPAPANCNAIEPTNIDGVLPDHAVILLSDGMAEAMITQTEGLPSGSEFPLGTTTNTFVATDSGGNTAECSFTVTVEDAEAPTFDCTDITVSLDDNGEYFITDDDVFNGMIQNWMDNCAPAPVAFGSGNRTITCDDLVDGTFEFFFGGRDAIGSDYNEMLCTATITVRETMAPMAVCQDITIQLDAAGMAMIEASDIDGGSSDDCGGVTIAADITEFTCDDVGDNMVVLTVTDLSDNTSTCMANVTIEDNVPPMAMCQDVTVSLDENGEATIAGGTVTMVTGVELGAVSQLPSDIISSVCGPVATAATICDCPDGYVATGVEGLESTDFGGLVGEFNIICRQLLPSGNLGATSMVTCTNGTANTTTVMGPISTTGDNVLVAGQSRIGCAINAITVYSAPMTQVLAGNNTPNTEVGSLEGIPGGGVRPLRTAPNNNVIVGMQTFDNQGNPSFTTGVAWRYAPIEEVLVQSAGEFEINSGSTDNCGEVTFTVTQSEFSCEDLIDGQVSTDVEVTLIVTDGSGNVSNCTSTVTVMDDIAPLITCPGTTTVNLEAGACDYVVHYIVEASDNCGLVADAEGNEITQTAGLPSGSVFERGTTTNTFEVIDASGNLSTCSFDVVVLEFPNPVTALSCNGNLNISLDQNCEAYIGADQILEGGGYGCYDDYEVTISGVTGQTILSPGTYSVTITDPDTGNSCWSEVTVEDKLEPTLVCSDCPPGSIMPIELPFTGTLDANSPTWTRPFGQVGACNPSGVGVGVSYSTHEFLVLTGADSDFEVVTFMGDSFMAIYEGSFDPTMPCMNMVTNNDDSVGLLSQFDVMLESNTQYILVVTTYEPGTYGDYVVELETEAELIVAPLECIFKCFDEAAILAGVQSVPSAVAMDNCTANLPVTYTDVVRDGETCGSRVITRTFSIMGSNGLVLTSCVAEYQLFPAQFSDFITPPAVVSLPCGSGTSPEEIEAYFDNKIDTDGDGIPDTDINPTNDINDPNCNLSVIENNEGTSFGYITYPSLGCDGNTHLQAVDNNMCGFYTTYSDQEIPTCGASCGSSNKKVIRTWTILDWCNADTAPFIYIQVIESADNEAPTIELVDDFGVSVNPWNCLGEFSLPAPTLMHDLCSTELSYTVSGPAGTTLLAPNTTSNPSDNWIVFGAPKGIVPFTYIVSDCCGNTSSAELKVNVYDTTPPVPVATENIIINLTTSGQLDSDGNAQGFAKLYNTSVDKGSYDGCSDVRIEIRREESPVACGYTGNSTYATNDDFPNAGDTNPTRADYDPDNGEYVKFCCADITDVDPVTGVEYGLIPVRMRVFDDGNMNGILGDWVDADNDGVQDAGEYDNFNETWVTVRVEGKAIASIVCPPDVTLACDMDYTDPAMIGTATTLALCGSESVDVTFNPQLDACGVGFVIATYTVVGSSNPVISCNQRIDIENPYPSFDPADINFPRSLPTNATQQISCTDALTYAAPTWTAGACDFIGYTEEVDTFFFEVDPNTGAPNDACFKILRRFTVIDWCVYDATNGQDGLYYGSQTIKITDRDAPVLNNCVAQMFEVDGECVRTSTVLTNNATDSGNCSSDWLKWQVFVDTWGDNVIDYEYSSFLPSNDSNITNDTNGNGINDKYLAPTNSGEDVSITVSEVIESSMFNHVVTWKVTDGCGNVASCTTTFMVVDKKAPTPYCVSLSTALMENSQAVELWAIDFDLGAFDNCTAQEHLRFTFSNTAPEDDSSYDASQRSSAMSFGTAGEIPVNVYVWDEKGNVDFCTVVLTVIDNGGSGLRVSGMAATELGDGVEDAEVLVEANLSEYPRIDMSASTGVYAFESNPIGMDYEVSVMKNDNHTNGVSTLDLVLIQRHILAFADLDSPYKVIAADINRDDKVSSIDVVELRKVILGVQKEFSQNTSWRFVDSGQVFADISSPWPVDETRTISSLSTDMEAEDFVAVKIGDVNATATDNVSGASTEVRSSETLLLELESRSVKAGEQVEITLSSGDFTSVSGLQMTVEFDGLAYTDVLSKAIVIDAQNVGVINDKVITMSWNTNTAITTSEDLFVIRAVATKDGNISEMIKVTDRVITPEVYIGSSLEVQNVELGIRGGKEVVLINELMQNEPNPFKEMTTISFKLAKAGKAVLTIRDVTGKVFRKVRGEYSAGKNTISISKSELNASGVLFYTLDSGEFSETMKMIVVE